MVTWEDKPLACPVHSSGHCNWQWDVDSEEDPISLIAEVAANWLFWAHTSVSVASLSAACQGQWPYISTSAVNWYEIQHFFRILQWFCLISKLIQTQFDGPKCCKDTSPTYSCLTINLCFGPITSQSLSTQFFCTMYTKLHGSPSQHTTL